LSNNVNLGEISYSGTLLPKNFNIINGIALPISYMSLFSVINSLETRPYLGIQLMRSAGMGAIISTKSIIMYQLN
jgi:ribosomal protein L2